MRSFLGSFALLLFLSLSLVYPGSTSPVSAREPDSLGLFEDHEVSHLQYRAEAQKFYLRIMPLGASIMRGSNDTPDLRGRGFRKFLRDKLRVLDWKVNMVGSFKNGQDFADNDTEGYPGFIVGPEDGTGSSSFHNRAIESVPKYKPTLVLINVGFNDANANNGAGNDLPNVGRRMEALLRTVFKLSPDTVVILSTLIPSRDRDTNVQYFNRQYVNVANKLKLQGFKIELADMHTGFITTDMLNPADGTHPNYDGAQRMASVWEEAIAQVAARKDWLKEPSSDVNFKDDDTSSKQTCEKSPDSGANDPRSGEQVLYAKSADIQNDGTYKHSSTSKGIIMKFFRNPTAPTEKQSRVYAAQIVNAGNAQRGGERDDYVAINGDTASEPAVYWLNDGTGGIDSSSQRVRLDFGQDCIARGIWGDVNNDGLDDFICLRPSGEMHVPINQGKDPATFKYVGKWKDAVDGYPQANVRLGDIDSDGRLDYCVISSAGALRCWRNGGIQADSVEYWQDLGTVWTTEGKDVGVMDGFSNEQTQTNRTSRSVDINGDFRSDCLWVNRTGRVVTWINQRGVSRNLVPRWLSAGVTHVGQGTDIGDRNNIIFGRMTSDSKTDYMYWDRKADENTNVAPLRLWASNGSGGDGVFWGDMTGNGNDDYLWISPEGRVAIFVNSNKPPDTSRYKDGAWIGKGYDGDGKADIIATGRATGALTIWLTSWDGQKLSFNKTSSGTSYCKEGWGVGLLDIGPRFADLTGNGCVDYLCMEPDGRTTGYLNSCSKDVKLTDAGQVKLAEKQKDRANFRFADVDGDGKADYLWVDKFSGDATVWYNRGRASASGNSGSSFKRENKGKAYSGSSRGANMHYPNLGGVGRADMVHVDPETAFGWVWYNTCSGGGGGDDGGVVPRDPELPFFLPEPICYELRCYGMEDDSTDCCQDPWADDFSDEYSQEDIDLARTLDVNETISERGVQDFEKRAGRRRGFRVFFVDLGITWEILVAAMRYSGSTHLDDPTRGLPATNNAFRLAEGCTAVDAIVVEADTLSRQTRMDGWDTEHNPDANFRGEAQRQTRIWGSGIALRTPNDYFQGLKYPAY
ncbi:putative carbohydrate esterase family 3 protein, partial [Fusarium bulbicola]